MLHNFGELTVNLLGCLGDRCCLGLLEGLFGSWCAKAILGYRGYLLSLGASSGARNPGLLEELKVITVLKGTGMLRFYG